VGRSIRLAAVAVATLVLVGAVGALSGCARNERQTTVIQPKQSSDLTPLERGQLRGRVLRNVEAGIGAWRVSDIAAMRRYFSKPLTAYNAKLAADYARQGRVRVRKHADVFMDVVEMSRSGTQVSVQYKFTNRSYFADGRTKKPLTKPSNRHGEIDFTVERAGSKWVIVRMFSSKDELL